MNPFKTTRITGMSLRLCALALIGAVSAHAADWWDVQWTVRKPIVINAEAGGVTLDAATGPVPVLIRLHDGNFQFDASSADGRDLRVIAADGKTELPCQVESFDSLLHEGFAWIQSPDLKPGAGNQLTLYYGNAAAEPQSASPFDDATLLVYHFGGQDAPRDFSGKGNNAANAGIAAPASLIGPGLRLVGAEPVRIPSSDTFRRDAGSALTWSAWVKPASLDKRGVVFHWGDTKAYFEIGLDAATPYAEIKTDSAPARASSSTPLASADWTHLAAVVSANTLTFYVNGQQTAQVSASLPALTTEGVLGADSTNANGFVGDLDELEISGAARTPGWIKFAAVSQSGSNDALKLVAVGDDEGGSVQHQSPIMEHLMLFVDIGHNMKFDGWVVVFFCLIMAIVCWSVAIRKFLYLGRIEKGSEEFLRRWKEVSSDLTALDHSDSESIKSLGGVANASMQKLMRQSPLYHLYHIGSDEIRNRIKSVSGFVGLSTRSIQAIKASLDAGLTRELHRINNGLVFLTISIAGGPYVGLLGTVIGVMITFAVIAKTGEVEVNSIAPGIAGALLATVAGLLVAIPALFLYSYINNRIKDVVTNMQLFIDEFVTKMAEFYPVKGDGSQDENQKKELTR